MPRFKKKPELKAVPVSIPESIPEPVEPTEQKQFNKNKQYRCLRTCQFANILFRADELVFAMPGIDQCEYFAKEE